MLVGLTLLIAFFVASELALVSADRHQIRQLAQTASNAKINQKAALAIAPKMGESNQDGN